MQDIQNIPNPDVNSNEANEDFGSHSDIEQNLDNESDDIESPDDDLEERDVKKGIEQVPNIEAH